mgnify:CR=1 FL=1
MTTMSSLKPANLTSSSVSLRKMAHGIYTLLRTPDLMDTWRAAAVATGGAALAIQSAIRATKVGWDDLP